MLDPTVQIPSGFHSSRFRHSQCRDAHVLGTPDSPIPDVLLSRALAPSGYTMVHVTSYHATVTIPLVGVSGFRTSWCREFLTSPIPDYRCAPFHALALLAIGLGPIRPSTHDLGQTSHRVFSVFDVTMHMPPGFSIPDFPMCFRPPGWPWFTWPLPIIASLSLTTGIH